MADKELARMKVTEDCTTLLTKTDNELRSIKYKLSTLISNGEGHIDLVLGVETPIEVFPSTLVYAKVYCKGKKAPLKMNIKYRTKGDIRIFSSYKEMMPNASNSQYQFKKVYNFQLWNYDPREHFFQNPFIYFTFYSNAGMKIIVKADFEEDKVPKKIYRHQSTDEVGEFYDEASQEDHDTEKFNRYVSKVLEEDKKSRTIK